MQVNLQSSAEIKLALEITILTPNGRETCEVVGDQWNVEDDSVSDAHAVLVDCERYNQKRREVAKAKTAGRLKDALAEFLIGERYARSFERTGTT